MPGNIMLDNAYPGIYDPFLVNVVHKMYTNLHNRTVRLYGPPVATALSSTPSPCVGMSAVFGSFSWRAVSQTLRQASSAQSSRTTLGATSRFRVIGSCRALERKTRQYTPTPTIPFRITLRTCRRRIPLVCTDGLLLFRRSGSCGSRR